MADEDRRSDE